MSDLTATNCGCNNSSTWGGNNNGCGCNWIIWILLLSCFCGGNNNGCGGILGGNNGCGCNDGCSNNSCEWLIWILLISCFCGGNNNGCC